MEFQIAEAVELIKTLAETENVTHTQALQTFVAEAGLDIEGASILKAALFEEYTLQEMASDTLTRALHNVFVAGTSDEELQEMDTKETQEGTKYKIRVKDRQSGSSYIRYATREKIAELRANPNISSVELTDHGQAGEDDDGSRTASAKGGGGDRDGDGKVESGSKEHAGVVHNAIQRKMGGKPDGQDTRKEGYERNIPQSSATARGGETAAIAKKASAQRTAANAAGARGPEFAGAAKMKQLKSTMPQNMRNSFEPEEDLVDEAMDFKGARREDDRREKIQKEKDKKSPSSKDRRLAMGKFRPGASKEERAEGGRDVMREKGTSPKKNGKKMFEAYLEYRAAKLAERFEVTDADEKGNTEAYKRYKAGNPAYKRAESKKKVAEGYKGKHGQSDKEHMDSRSDAAKQISGDSETSGAEYSHRSYRGVGKPAKPGERQKNQGKMTDADRNELAIRKNALKKKTQKEDFLPEGDLVNAGSENEGERQKKKLTGKGVDNSGTIKLMPRMEAVVTDHSSSAISKLNPASFSDTLRAQIKEMRAGLEEECCPNCGTPECTCEGKKDEKPKKKREPKAKLDEAGMPILEYSRNDASGPTKEMIDPPADPTGEPGVMNPKGKPKRYKNKGEAPGDRRPNDPSGPELPLEKGTVPNGSGV